MRMSKIERIIINDKSRITNEKVVWEWMQNDDWKKIDMNKNIWIIMTEHG